VDDPTAEPDWSAQRTLLESKLASAQMELRACKQVIEVQEQQISDSSARDRDPRGVDVLRVWRQKVFQLLVQRESADLVSEKEQAALTKECSVLWDRVRLGEKKMLLAHKSGSQMQQELVAAQNRLAQLEQQVVGCEARRQDAVQQLEVERAGVQDAWAGMLGVQQLTDAMLAQFAKVGARVGAMQQRVDFATARVSALLDPQQATSPASAAFFMARRDASYAVKVVQGDSGEVRALKQEVNRLSAEKKSVVRHWQGQVAVRDAQVSGLVNNNDALNTEVEELARKLKVAWSQFTLGEQNKALLLRQIQLAREESRQEAQGRLQKAGQRARRMESKIRVLDVENDALAEERRQLKQRLGVVEAELEALKHIRRPPVAAANAPVSSAPPHQEHQGVYGAASPLGDERQLPQRDTSRMQMVLVDHENDDEPVSSLAVPLPNVSSSSQPLVTRPLHSSSSSSLPPASLSEQPTSNSSSSVPAATHPLVATFEPFKPSSDPVLEMLKPVELVPRPSLSSGTDQPTDAPAPESLKWDDLPETPSKQPAQPRVQASLVTSVSNSAAKKKKSKPHLSVRINRLKNLSQLLMTTGNSSQDN
jgi:uncharacterized protein YukE